MFPKNNFLPNPTHFPTNTFFLRKYEIIFFPIYKSGPIFFFENPTIFRKSETSWNFNERILTLDWCASYMGWKISTNQPTLAGSMAKKQVWQFQINGGAAGSRWGDQVGEIFSTVCHTVYCPIWPIWALCCNYISYKAHMHGSYIYGLVYCAITIIIVIIIIIFIVDSQCNDCSPKRYTLVYGFYCLPKVKIYTPIYSFCQIENIFGYIFFFWR